jgi:hypothetical protein
MSENNKPKTRGMSLKSPSDVRKIARRVISEIFTDGSQIENAGKLNQLLLTWLKAWEMETIASFEERLKRLEEAAKK